MPPATSSASLYFPRRFSSIAPANSDSLEEGCFGAGPLETLTGFPQFTQRHPNYLPEALRRNLLALYYRGNRCMVLSPLPFA